MNLENLKIILRNRANEQIEQAAHSLIVEREMMDLEPLDEPLQHLTLVEYEIVDGISEERRRVGSFVDWESYVIRSDAIEDAANGAF